jgi:hypothetical protein
MLAPWWRARLSRFRRILRFYRPTIVSHMSMKPDPVRRLRSCEEGQHSYSK